MAPDTTAPDTTAGAPHPQAGLIEQDDSYGGGRGGAEKEDGGKEGKADQAMHTEAPVSLQSVSTAEVYIYSMPLMLFSFHLNWYFIEFKCQVGNSGPSNSLDPQPGTSGNSQPGVKKVNIFSLKHRRE